MTFAHPWLLLGGLAALLPLLVHLFDRRRPRPHPFAAISFVLRSQRRTASRLKLKRLLLYVLRTLIFLALPLALSRPELTKDPVAATPTRGPAATAIVLDASMSMQYADGTSLFEHAKEQARDSLKDLLPEEPANVLVCGLHPQPPGPPLFDRTRLRWMVDQAQVSFASSDVSRCVELAVKSLEESPLPNKRVVVISDFTQNAFRLEGPPPTFGAPGAETDATEQKRQRPDVVLRDVTHGAEVLPNHAIVDLKTEPALQAGPRTYQFTATVRNFSSSPVKNLEVALRLNDQTVAKGFLDLGPGGTGQKTLTYRFNAGGSVSGEVALTPDALTADDSRSFTLWVPQELKALIVNGSPHSVRYRDEAFFVEAALSAPGSPVQPTLRDLDAAFKEDLSTYHVVYLLNVPAPAENIASALIDFVKAGGGLFISMGDNVNPDAYNQRLQSLLPRALRLVKTAAERSESNAETKAARLGQFEETHAIFAPFTGKAREGLTSARFYRYMLLEAAGGAPNLGETLAAYEDGAPALTLSTLGKGRVLLFTSTVDRDWADFSIRTAFLPLMQRFAAYLSGSLEERTDLRVRVGDTLTLPSSDDSNKPVSVESPSGETLEVRSGTSGAPATGPVVEPGVHTVRDAQQKMLPQLTFAVSVDPAESDLARLKTETLSAYYGEGSVKTAGLSGNEAKTPFWTWLIVAAVIAFFLEGLLLRQS